VLIVVYIHIIAEFRQSKNSLRNCNVFPLFLSFLLFYFFSIKMKELKELKEFLDDNPFLYVPCLMTEYSVYYIDTLYCPNSNEVFPRFMCED